MGDAVVGKVVDFLFGVAKKEIGHMWNCSENIENLKKKAGTLSDMKGRVQEQINLAQSKGECILESVVEWMNTSDAKISEAQEFSEKAEANKTCCNLRFCVNLGALYRYGKMAEKKTSSLVEHQEDGKGFETCVSLPAIAPGFIDLYQQKDLENIHTQKTALKAIVEAFKNHQIVGIVGLGGVGKTTLANEAAKELKSQFKLIKSITISQTINKEKIKEGVDVAAKRIINGDTVLIILDDVWEELKLDELGIPCGSNYANCKILLTSRREDVCKIMEAEIIKLNPLKEKEAWTLFKRAVGEREWDERLKNVALNIVKECDGLPLFIQAVGKALKIKDDRSWEAALHRLQDATDDDDEYKKKGIAQLKLSYDYLEGTVARSCFLLCSLFPEDYIIGIDELAHYGLTLGIFNKPGCNIQEAKDKVIGAVESLKSCFLLLPGRNQKEEGFKMHDLVRDMAILITSKRNNDKFLVLTGPGLTEWQSIKDLERYTKISFVNNEICELPDHELLFPNIDTFLVRENKLSTVPKKIFEDMKKLKVLNMSWNRISSLPQSLKEVITGLTMLDLSHNESLCEISILGKLICLEILKLKQTGITIIPEEIGKLTKLRLLDVYECSKLSYVTPGVISKLIRLEELYLGLTKEGNCEVLAELSKLKLLTVLHLKVSDLRNVPKDFHFKKLTKFEIMEHNTDDDRPLVPYRNRILRYLPKDFHFKKLTKFEIMEHNTDDDRPLAPYCNRFLHYVPFHSKKLTKFDIMEHNISILIRMDDDRPFAPYCNRILAISNNNFSITMLMMKLIPLTEMLVLVGIEDLDNILPGLYREEFDELKFIELLGCKNVKRLVKTCELGPMKTKGKFFSKLEEIWLIDLNKLEVLWDMPHPYISFCNLANIYICNCDSLLELFPLSVAQGLVNLRSISISNCRRLVAVISQGDEQTSGSEIEKTIGDKSQTGLVKQDLVFPFLDLINLRNLPELVSFYSGHSTIAYPSLKLIEVTGCKSMERWSNGENHIPNIKFEHQGEQYMDLNNYFAAQTKTNGWFFP